MNSNGSFYFSVTNIGKAKMLIQMPVAQMSGAELSQIRVQRKSKQIWQQDRSL